ncbi:MAG: tetratricopeptide repeat protein [Deltaproteobacteria bacterium]|nr:tetratricopeptide repeat protein [Deltaproteobacteria bacterium]
MAAPRKRILRKEIRQPDRFMVWTGLALDWVKANRNRLIGAGAAIVVVVATVFGWQYYRGYRQDLAVRDYSKALVEYQEGRYEAALEAFGNLREAGEAPYDKLAHLYVANSYIALEQPAKAVEVLASDTAGERDDIVGQVMLVTLGLAQEMNGACEEALTTLNQALDRPGPLRQEAMLGKARCSARLGKTQDAAETYKTYLKEFPEAETVEIALRLQQLEGNSGKPADTTKATQ